LRANEFSFEKEKPYVITGMNFKDGKIRWDEVYHFSEDRYNEAPEIQLKEGDVLMTKDGTIGKLLFVDYLPGPTSLNSHLLLFRPLKKDYVPKFLYYLFESNVFKNYVEIAKTGTTFFGITQEATGEFQTLLPLIKEQSNIANYLDEKTMQIDKLIANKQKLIELFKEERTAIINEAVNGKGKNWERKKLKYVMDNFDSIRVPLNGEQRGDEKKIYDYYGASGVIDKVPEYLFDGEYILIGEDGANLLTRSLALAYKATGKFWVNNHAHILRPKEGNIDFYVFLLESMEYTTWVTGSAQPKLTAENLMNIELLIPKGNEQIQIVSHIQTETQRIDSTISKIEKEIELMQEYRTALISEVVTGKIKVA
jgi:type I restriction enzyme S subunit